MVPNSCGGGGGTAKIEFNIGSLLEYIGGRYASCVHAGGLVLLQNVTGPHVQSLCHNYLNFVFPVFLVRFSVTKTSNLHQADFFLLVDGTRFAYHDLNASIYGSYYPTGSFTITIQLNAGQLVQVENDNSDYVFGTVDPGYIQSFFAGHLLFGL